ncbi:hypothetical protein FFWV33_10105 [Flavobacterium faecale]|uniref:Uncharacterized protein n=1 Tax=Flavobacterium faecale TaxID=1355330 RepID=A0A2S1LDN2_9FLAO|nr:hypothetical protein FFWV33_10105 [Flavobacterium faecale]
MAVAKNHLPAKASFVGKAFVLNGEGKHYKTILTYPSKKRGRFVLQNYLNLFIDIPIVAEVEG